MRVFCCCFLSMNVIYYKKQKGGTVMADHTYSFRSALNGFHRGDVISFLEALTLKHAAELEEKTEALRLVREEVERLRQENLRLQASASSSGAGREKPAADTPRETPSAAAAQELEAYRRAERYEREARLRAGKIYGDVSAAVDSAGAKLSEQEKYLTSVSATISSDIAALQAAMGDIRIELNATRERMKEMKQGLQTEE